MQALKVLVIVMGLMIVAGVAIVVTTIVNRMSAPPRTTTGFDTVRLAMPAGCRVLEATAVGERLALRLGDGPRCQSVLLIDPASGRLAGRIDLEAAP